MRSTLERKNLLQEEQIFSFNPLYTGHPERGTLANIVDPDQMPHNVASDQGLHCLLTGLSIENRIKATK